MFELSLGTRIISIEDGWLAFNTVSTSLKDGAIVMVQFNNINSNQANSYFVARLNYSAHTGQPIAKIVTESFLVDSIRQYFTLNIPPQFADKQSWFISVRRFSMYGNPSQLKDANLTLTLLSDKNFN